jgi:flagellar biosynthetic protein FlhB
MAEEQDPSSKTEEPTGRRLEQSFEKGDIARSAEIGHWFMMVAATIALILFAPGAARRIGASLLPFLDRPHAMPTDGAQLVAAMARLAGEVALALLPALALFVAFAIASNLVQNRPGIAWGKLKPELSRVSPMTGLKRLFSVTALVEFAKGLAKISVVAIVAWLLVKPELAGLELLVAVDVAALLPKVADLTLVMLGGIVAVMALIAGADLLYQKLSHLRRLRMTRQEVKEELKQTEGDPHVKARLRSLRLERARRRMMAAVPQADVVVTNPTHFAVALKYDQARMSAPVVVAKGVDLLAQRIRELAQKHGVPVVENPPLARALYLVDLDREIPVEHYRAVAEIIGYVMRLRGRLRPQPSA